MDARASARVWTAAAAAIAAPAVLFVCLTLWRSPYPITEAIAIFEDVERYPPSRFLVPELTYYRPLFHLTIDTIWHEAGSLPAALDAIKLLHIGAVLLLAASVLLYLRPASIVEAGAAAASVAVLVGSPGFRDNLELPLLYTIVGMPMAVLVWIVLNRAPRWWHAAAVAACAAVAIGFKEQGLVVVAVGLAAWLTRAPGATRGITVMLVGMAVVYVAARLVWRGEWAMFEQSVGYGFSELSPADAEARFGGFPYGVYAYNGLSTISNILFGEPSRGIFRTVRAFVDGQPRTWQVIHVVSSTTLTAAIAWWSVRQLRAVRAGGWSTESRLVVALAAAVLASGALSFNYSRDRLGGMAVPFYAMCAYFALRAIAERARSVPRARAIAIAVAGFVLVAGWQTRAIGTVEHVRAISWHNHTEWLTLVHGRREEFAERPVYLRIMDAMSPQGRDIEQAPRRLLLAEPLTLVFGEP